MSTEYVAVGVLVNKNNQVLIARRAADKHMGNKWEFPGGKVEKGESSLQALFREMKEELGIVVESAEPLTQIVFDYSSKKVVLDVFVIKHWTGEAKGMEGQPIRWVEKADLQNYEFPTANTEIVSTIIHPTA